MKRFVPVSICMLIAFGSAVAPTAARGEDVCRAQWKAVCGKANDPPSRRACLSEKAEQLPEGCLDEYREAVEASRKKWRAVNRECKQERTNLCTGVGGKISMKADCLRENSDSLSAACSEALAEYDRFGSGAE
jgi:hypothetical protein